MKNSLIYSSIVGGIIFLFNMISLLIKLPAFVILALTSINFVPAMISHIVFDTTWSIEPIGNKFIINSSLIFYIIAFVYFFMFCFMTSYLANKVINKKAKKAFLIIPLLLNFASGFIMNVTYLK